MRVYFFIELILMEFVLSVARYTFDVGVKRLNNNAIFGETITSKLQKKLRIYLLTKVILIFRIVGRENDSK